MNNHTNLNKSFNTSTHNRNHDLDKSNLYNNSAFITEPSMVR